jgi:hypothetical protein
LEISPDDLNAVGARLERDNLNLLAFRFDGDRFCSAQRFLAYREALGDHFIERVLPDTAANPDTHHSVTKSSLAPTASSPPTSLTKPDNQPLLLAMKSCSTSRTVFA